MRVHEFAKELGLTSKRVIDECAELGIAVKNHMSSLDESAQARLSERLSGGKAVAKPAPAKKKKTGKKKVAKTAKAKAKAKPKAKAKKTARAKPKTTVKGAVKPKPKPKPKAKPEPPVEVEPGAAQITPVGVGEGPAPGTRIRLRPTPPSPARPKRPPRGAAAPRAPREEHPPRREGGPPRAGEAPAAEAPSARTERPSRGERRSPDQRGTGGADAPAAEGRRPKGKRKVFFAPTQMERGRRRRRGRQSIARTVVVARPSSVEVTPPISVKGLSSLFAMKANELLGKLIELGTMVTINDLLDQDAIALLAETFGIEVKFKEKKDLERELIGAQPADKPEDLEPRAPVVAFLGHVDHGKTSLLDAIRQTSVAEGESGGITQHLGASRVDTAHGPVVFLDTPGHEAFTAMRARGANITDIVVLVVAADDGVMPQTEEAIAHAKAAGVPIVVAINKIDLPGADPTRVKQRLADLDLLSEEWQGETLMVETSATTKQGIDELLESLMLQTELLELKANPNKPARGTVIEGELSEGRGVVATVLVEEGTLRRGDAILAGAASGRARILRDSAGRSLKSAGPARPVQIAGLDDVPEAGDKFYVLDNLQKSREIALEKQRQSRIESLASRRHVSLETLFATIEQEHKKELRVIIKADVQGSIEVLTSALEKLSTDEVSVNILHKAVGGINESDVLLADASDAIIIGFHVVPEARARALADEKGVETRLYQVIYHITEDIRAGLEARLEPEKREEVTGHLEVRKVFRISRVGSIAGCYVTDGVITRNVQLRVIRDNIVIYTGKVGSLRRVKDDVREAREGFECGVKIEGYNDVKENDILETFHILEIARKL